LPLSIGAKSCSSFTATWSITLKPPTCPSRLQPVHQAKSCLDLLHLSHMTPCHVLCAMSSFIICSPVYLTQTHISPPNVVTQLPKPDKDISAGSLNSTLVMTIFGRGWVGTCWCQRTRWDECGVGFAPLAGLGPSWGKGPFNVLTSHPLLEFVHGEGMGMPYS
jgi:hypothetical protein